MIFKLVLFVTLHFVILRADDASKNTLDKENVKPGLLTPKIYSNIFVRRREEHKLLLKHLKEIDKYEKKYKLLEIALSNILKVVEENRKMIFEANLEDSNDFPANQSLKETISLVLENTCLFGELILHFPNISYKIVKNSQQWHENLNWALNYTRNNFKQIIDQKTLQMLDLFNQEINEEQRTEDYVNPYYDNLGSNAATKTKKAKKKLKRGPQLARNEL